MFFFETYIFRLVQGCLLSLCYGTTMEKKNIINTSFYKIPDNFETLNSDEIN